MLSMLLLFLFCIPFECRWSYLLMMMVPIVELSLISCRRPLKTNILRYIYEQNTSRPNLNFCRVLRDLYVTMSVRRSIRRSVRPSVRRSVGPLVGRSVGLSVRQSICPSVGPSPLFFTVRNFGNGAYQTIKVPPESEYSCILKYFVSWYVWTKSGLHMS